MDCKKIQESILTDYIDDRMEDKPKSLIDQHVAHCHACKDFLISIKKEVLGPLQNVRKAVPDEFLWARIKQAVEGEQEKQLEKSLVPDFWEKIRSAVHIPRPAFALASFVMMIFMIGTTGQFLMNSQVIKVNGPDQMEYLSSLIDEPVDVTGNNGKDPQTPIEQYFL